MVFLASSVALRMASGTSRALPWPKPTRPFWSPTTISAANEKRRPPFTVAATRLMCTSFSTMSLSRSSVGALRSRRSPRSSLRAISIPLEIQAGFARGVGEGLDAAVEQVAAAIEDHVLDALFQGAFGDQLADALGGGLVGTLPAVLAPFEARGGGHRDALGVIDDLGVDVLRRAEHRQAGAAAGHRLQAKTCPLGAALGHIARRERHGLLLLAFLTTDLFARVLHA